MYSELEKAWNEHRNKRKPTRKTDNVHLHHIVKELKKFTSQIMKQVINVEKKYQKQ